MVQNWHSHRTSLKVESSTTKPIEYIRRNHIQRHKDKVQTKGWIYFSIEKEILQRHRVKVQPKHKAIGNTDAFPYINECFIRFAPLSFLTKKFCWKSESINLKETFFTTLRFVLIIPKGARPILHTLRIWCAKGIGIPHYPSMLMTFSCKLHSNWCW